MGQYALRSEFDIATDNTVSRLARSSYGGKAKWICRVGRWGPSPSSFSIPSGVFRSRAFLLSTFLRVGRAFRLLGFGELALGELEGSLPVAPEILRAISGPPAESSRDGGRNAAGRESRKRAERGGSEPVVCVAREAEHGECCPGRQCDPRHPTRQERGHRERTRRLVTDEVELESGKLRARLGRRVGCSFERSFDECGCAGASVAFDVSCVTCRQNNEREARRPRSERDQKTPRNAQNGSREIAFSMRSANGCLSSASVSFG